MKANRKAMYFLENAKGSMASDVALEVVLISIVVIIGILIFAQVRAAIPGTALTNASNATITTVESTFYSALTLVVISLIVLAAVAIISIVQRVRS